MKKFSFFKKDTNKLTPQSAKILLNAISVSRYFYAVAFLGYLFGYIMRGVGITMIIPLTKGLIEKNYSFIFNNKIISYLSDYFPFIKRLSDLQIFFFFACMIIMLTSISLAFNYVISLYIWREKKTYSLRATSFILEKYMSLGMGFFIHYKPSILIAKLTHIPRQSDLLITNTQGLLQLFFEMVMIVIILFAISPYLALLACVFFSITGSVFNFMKRTIKKIASAEIDASMQYDAKIQDILSRQILIFSTNNQKNEQNQFINTHNTMNDRRYQAERTNNMINAFFLTFQIICIIAIGLLLGKTVFFSEITSISAAVVFLGLFRRGMTKIQSFGMMSVQRSSARNMLEQLMEDIINLKPPVQSGAKKFTFLQESIRFKNLTFSYDKNVVLKNISLTIPAHKMTVITGENGSGKSTLISLILRFYDCPRGTIFLDDHDIHMFDILSWRTKLAYVSQDVIFFHGTLRENMTYGHKKRVSKKRLIEILGKVGLTDFVKKLPEGLETNIGDSGLKLSGGQRQRIAIARALLYDPEIIIFDEATKSIDRKMDQLIMKMLVNDFSHTTRIIISHNDSHHALADQLIVLNKGAVENIQSKI